jgi:L-aspartate oxidase
MGGIAVDLDGRTSVPGLYACGEVAATGVHGANRLASNSLLESVVYPERIARAVADSAARRTEAAGVDVRDDAPPVAGTAHDWASLRDTMYADVGVERDEAGLSRALERFQALAGDAPSDEVRDAATVAALVARAALRRRETRGSHTRSDYPEARPAEGHRSFITLAGTGHAARSA